MTERSIARLVLPALLFAIAVSLGASTGGKEVDDSVVAHLRNANDSSSVTAAGTQNKGRYKKQGDDCLWDAEDSGPNQCTPQTEGRFKRDGDNCVWDAKDKGPDQCRPKTGRFKKEGSACVWTANDSGPNQCNPKQPR